MSLLHLRSSLMLVLTVVLAVPYAAPAQAPQKMNYQVMLTDDADEPLADQTVELVFRIYDAASSGSMLWTETQSATTNSIGVATALLGDVNPLNFGFEVPTWLEIDVDGETLTPRRELVSAPYALRAAVADSIAGVMAGDGDWIVDGDNMHAVVSGYVGIGTTYPMRKLHIDNGNTDDGIRIAYGSNYSTLLADLRHGGSQGFIINSYAGGGSWADIRLQTNSNTRMFIDQAGRVGIGTESPTEKLDVAGTIQTESFKMAGGAGTSTTAPYVTIPNGLLKDLSRSIVLIGLMGAGKSCIGRHLASSVGRPFIDADKEIELAAGCRIPEIFEQHGEAEFRDGERLGTATCEEYITDYPGVEASVQLFAFGEPVVIQVTLGAASQLIMEIDGAALVSAFERSWNCAQGAACGGLPPWPLWCLSPPDESAFNNAVFSAQTQSFLSFP